MLHILCIDTAARRRLSSADFDTHHFLDDSRRRLQAGRRASAVLATPIISGRGHFTIS